MKTKTKLNIKIQGVKKDSFQCLILNTKGTKNSFDGKILGLTLAEWVKFACENIPCNIVDFDKSNNIWEVAKENINKSFDYTLILFSSTPLISHQTLADIIEYSIIKNVNLCKLHMGYVVKNAYLLKEENPFVDSVFAGGLEDFYIVENKSQFTYAFKILSERINNFHIANGVDIVSPTNTHIEPFVDIDYGVKIYPNNTLKGKTTIASGVILKEGNTIADSKIMTGSCLSHSIIEDSIISQNVFVGSFSEIKNSLIEENTVIENKCYICNYNVKADSIIKSNTNLGENNDSSSGAR